MRSNNSGKKIFLNFQPKQHSVFVCKLNIDQSEKLKRDCNRALFNLVLHYTGTLDPVSMYRDNLRAKA